MKKYYMCSLFCCLLTIGLLLAAPQHAYAVDEENTTQTFQERSDGSARIRQAIELRRIRQATAANAREASQRVRESVRRTKESVRALKERLDNTGADYSMNNKERMRMIRDTIERNRIQQQTNRQIQKDRMRMIKDQTESLKQKLKENAERNRYKNN